MLGCEPFFFTGFNSYALMEMAAEVPVGSFQINWESPLNATLSGRAQCARSWAAALRRAASSHPRRMRAGRPARRQRGRRSGVAAGRRGAERHDSPPHVGLLRQRVVPAAAQPGRVRRNHVCRPGLGLARGIPARPAARPPPRPRSADAAQSCAAAVVAQARPAIVCRVVLVFTDWWASPGGVPEYVAWSKSAAKQEDFYSDANCRSLYKRHVRTLLSRVNSLNGRQYVADPTILGYEIMNEPRCRRCQGAMRGWLHEMAAYVKHLDPHHLLTVGEVRW